jgi:hypothetical protein
MVNLLTALSLLVCVAAVALWVRSYRAGDWWLLDWRVAVVASKGQVSFRFSTGSPSVGQEATPGWRHRAEQPMRLAVPRGMSRETIGGMGPNQYTSFEFGLWGLGVRHNYNSQRGAIFLLVPYWFVVAAALVIPALRIVAAARRWLRRRRKSLGLCSRCGYDMRATPDHCPECGTPAGVMIG